jgi:hypothetical protein
MLHEERLFQISLAEFALKQAEMQAMFSKMVLLRFQNLEDTRKMRAQLERLPDSDEKAAIAAQLSVLESSVDVSADTKILTGLLARQESDHEKMEALLKTLRASLPPPPS